jgi:trehalose transport system permease protein
VAALFAWLESWNEFTYALSLSLTEHTLPIQVYYYVRRGNSFDSATYAALLTGSVVVVTPCLQRYLKAGYLAGAMKG